MLNNKMDCLTRAWRLLFCLILPFTGNTQSSAPTINLPPIPLVNQTAITNDYTFTQLGWNNAITLNGYKPNATLYLPLAKRLNVQKIVLHLTIAFSPQLTQGTKVDIEFNQTLINSLSLPDDLTKEINLDIELPVTQLSPSWQTLSFSAYLNSQKTLCDPNIWIYISPKSSITVNSINLPFNASLNELPYPFVDPTAITPIATQLLLPKAPSLQEIISLLQIAFKLGKQADDTKATLSSGIIDDPKDISRNSNLIIVGLLEHILANKDFKNFAPGFDIHSPISQGNGILSLTQSPFNSMRGLLVISGSNYEALDKASKAFLTTEFNASAAGKLAFVETIKLPKKKEPIDEFYETTLRNLGYADKSISGLGGHRLSFNIPLPNDRIPGFTRIKTFITTPIFNEQGFSQLTLLINDQKQSSTWPSKEHWGWDTIIDPSSLKPGVNKLDYLIDLYFANNIYERCSRENYDEVWATIHAQTQINASFSGDFPLAMLNQLPVPFADEMTAILPEKLTTEDIKALSQLFFKFGRLFQSNEITINFRGSNDIDEEFIRNNNVIIFGLSDANPWMQYALKYMPVQFKKNSRYLKISEKELEILTEHSTGLLELMPSPWSEGHAVLLITGDNKQGLLNAVDALVEDQFQSNLNGNIAFINPDHSLETLNSYDNRYLSPSYKMMIYLNNLTKNIYYYLRNRPQIFIYTLVFLVPLIIVFRNRRK